MDGVRHWCLLPGYSSEIWHFLLYEDLVSHKYDNDNTHYAASYWSDIGSQLNHFGSMAMWPSNRNTSVKAKYILKPILKLHLSKMSQLLHVVVLELRIQL